MPMFKLKSPELFPIAFHGALKYADYAFVGDQDLTEYTHKMELGIREGANYLIRGKKDKPKTYGWRTAEQLIEIERKRFVAFKSMILRSEYNNWKPFLASVTIRSTVTRFPTGWGLTLTFKRERDVIAGFEAALAGNPSA